MVLDLVGLNTDYQNGRQTMQEFGPTADRELQNKFNTKLLGYWPFGPQVLFCNHEPCELNKPFTLIEVPVSDMDLAVVSDGLMGSSFPAWAEVCDASFDTCSQEWMDTVGARVAN